jgi:hypothetical protein
VTFSLEAAQRLEESAPLRIKFASMNDRGDLIGDAGEEYLRFFTSLPDGWRAGRLGDIDTRREYLQPAWLVSRDELNLVAVQHETGIELILEGVATGVLSNAATSFIKWAWGRWQELRKDSPNLKTSPSFVIEVPRADSSAPPIRLVIPPPVTDEDLGRYLRVALASRESTPIAEVKRPGKWRHRSGR